MAIKIPPFWPADPEVWFAQVEAQFSTQNITNKRTHFDHVIAALAPEITTEVRDLLLSPLADHPYDVLRAELIKKQQLWNNAACNSYSPQRKAVTSNLLSFSAECSNSAGPNPDNRFLRELFLQRLPGP